MEAYLLIFTMVLGFEPEKEWIEVESMEQCENSLSMARHNVKNNMQDVIVVSFVACVPNKS